MGAKVTPIKLGTTEMTLFFRVPDAKLAEQRMGKSIKDAMIAMSITDLSILVWAGLRATNPRITVEEVDQRLDAAKQAANNRSTFSWWDTVADALVESGILPRPEQSAVPDPTSSSPLGSAGA